MKITIIFKKGFDESVITFDTRQLAKNYINILKSELIEAFGEEYEHFLKEEDQWCDSFSDGYYTVPKFRGVVLPKGTINKLIGQELTWDHEPVEI